MSKISDAYLQMQKELHKNPNYGVASLGYASLVRSIFEQSGSSSISDYGAGKRNLKVGLEREGLKRFDYFPYDPVFPEYGNPQSADLVCCIDVLEHIEPELIDNVITELSNICTNLGFFSIHMGPAAKTLIDGRNAHLIQKPTSWWLGKLISYFEVLHLSLINI